VDAVGRDELLEVVVVPRRELVAPGGIRFVEIDPRRRRIAVAADDDVRALGDVEHRPLPADAVGRRRVARVLDVAAHVPHLEDAVFRVVEDAVAERHRRRVHVRLRPIGVRISPLPRRRRREYRTGRMVFGAMKRAHERRPLDQEIVDEQLAAEIDRNDGGRVDVVRRRDRRRRKAAHPRRPGIGELNAVV